MDEVDRRGEALVSCPLGCAFLLLVEQLGYDPEVAAGPVTSFHLLAEALDGVCV